MPGPIVFEEIKEAVDFLEQVVSEWQSTPREEAAMVIWRGMDRQAVSQAIEEAAASLFDLIAGDDIEDSHAAHALVLAIDAFDDAFSKWAEQCQLTPDRTDPSGGPEVWEPFRRMLDARVQKVYPKPEPIEALVAGKVSHAQIAKIYGWRDASGAPDILKVQEEITVPGMHYKPAAWVHPGESRAVADVADRWAARNAKSRPSRTVAKPKAPKETPETLDELIYDGVNVAQIAKMKRITPDAVRARAAELGVPLDGSILAAAAAKRRMPSPTEDEEEIAEKAEALRILGANDYGDLGDDMKARVLAISADGRPPRDIVKILAGAFPTLTYQKVTRLIDEAKLAATAK